MQQQSQATVSSVRDASMLTTTERRARSLRPTVYCPPSNVDECVNDLRAKEAE